MNKIDILMKLRRESDKEIDVDGLETLEVEDILSEIRAQQTFYEYVVEACERAIEALEDMK